MALNLSDSELSQKLRGMGVDVGPITNTTRDLYIRKYKSLSTQSRSPDQASIKPQPQQSSPVHVQQYHHWHQDQENTNKVVRPITPPQQAPPPAVPSSGCDPTASIACATTSAVVEQLLLSFDNPGHVASDTAFLFPSGEVILASRSVLAAQCSNMVPVLYNSEVPYPVRVVTLSGQTSEFLVRGGELVRDLKEKVCMIHTIPMAEQRLVFKEQELLDFRTLGSYEINSGAMLNLVLMKSEVNFTCVNYSCPSMTPTLSLYHFNMGLSLEQLSYFTQATPLTPLPQRVLLPSHLTHVVHIHDSTYSGFKMFLWYLYCRKLQEVDKSNQLQWSSYLMCYVLGKFFQLPCLVQCCLSAIRSCLNTNIAQALLEFSKSIDCQSLQQLCQNYIELPWPT